jgi:GNAT superfamily N-acetyltransferase
MTDADVSFRVASQEDEPFLTDMLVEAFNWDSGREALDRGRILADPEAAHYIAGWKRPGDLGVVAVEPGGQSVGAAWLRLFSDDDRGYGFVAADVPELTLGVVEHWRGKGVGRALLEEVVREAAGAGFGSISLSVERANHAALLYVSVGFTVVESGRDSDTMVNITGAQL